MTGPLLAALILLAAVGVWLVRPRRRPEAEPWERDVVELPDRGELDQAERDARNRASGDGPEEEMPGGDWGPGVPR